jgi:hypothetical protein
MYNCEDPNTINDTASNHIVQTRGPSLEASSWSLLVNGFILCFLGVHRQLRRDDIPPSGTSGIDYERLSRLSLPTE